MMNLEDRRIKPRNAETNSNGLFTGPVLIKSNSR